VYSDFREKSGVHFGGRNLTFMAEDGTADEFWARASLSDKVGSELCLVVKVASADNNADIGTKRVPLQLFNALTYRLVNRDKTKNLQLVSYIKYPLL
jgi:hypothetical protein